MNTADVIVIGGGVIGNAVAFYLAKQGVRRVLLLERDLIAQGNSSLAAGLLTQGRFKAHLIPMVLETYRAIQEIESLSRESLGMQRSGCIYAAVSPTQKNEIGELAAISAQAGLKVESIDNIEAQQLAPWLKVPPESSVFFMSEDAYIDGYTLTNGYLRSAKKLGVEVREQTEVLSITRAGQCITGVETTGGNWSAALVVDAAGIWAGRLAREIGVGLPMAPVRSHYWLTAENEIISQRQPFVILPDARAYARPESNTLLFGFRESQSVAVNPQELPEQMLGYAFKQDPNGWETLLEGIPGLGMFLPIVEEIEITSYIKGFSNYTPDGNFVLGGWPALDGFLAATGCAGAGIAMSGGMGRFISEIATGQALYVDPAPHRLDRFGAIDPFETSFLLRCAQARSGKITG